MTHFIGLFNHDVLDIVRYRVESLQRFLLEGLVHLSRVGEVLVSTATVMALGEVQQGQLPANSTLKDVNVNCLEILLELIQSVDHRFLLFLDLGRLSFFTFSFLNLRVFGLLIHWLVRSIHILTIFLLRSFLLKLIKQLHLLFHELLIS